MYLKKDKWEIIIRLAIACILFTGAAMCFAYVLTTKDDIKWYWLGLCVSGIFIGLISAIVITVSTFLD